jgi:hypothetical protein
MSKKASSVEDTEARSAMKLALEALNKLTDAAEGFSVSGVYFNEGVWEKECLNTSYDAIKALEEALAKQEQGEPVAYLVTGPYEKQPFANINSAKAYREGLNKGFGEDAYTISNLYTTPQQPSTIVRTWVGLTDEQIREASLEAGMQEHYMGFHSGFTCFARAIEAKLKEKNSA